jgi:hypothetical protein
LKYRLSKDMSNMLIREHALDWSLFN